MGGLFAGRLPIRPDIIFHADNKFIIAGMQISGYFEME